jgi:hypothetical protein
MESSQEQFLPEWVDDYRRSRRWVDARTVLARMDREETLGKMVDVSMGGMKVDFASLTPLVGRRLEMAVVFGDRVIDLGGTVLYRRRSGDGSTVGLEFDQPLDQEVEGFLATRYPPSMEGGSASAPGNA